MAYACDEAFGGERPALNHLVVNAIKFTGTKGEITVAATSDGEPEVTITDIGVGIAEDDLPHVFDRFYRCHSAEVMAVQGPGSASRSSSRSSKPTTGACTFRASREWAPPCG